MSAARKQPARKLEWAMRPRQLDRLLSAALIMLCLGVLLASTQIREIQAVHDPLGPALVPRALALMIIGGSIWLLLRPSKSTRSSQTSNGDLGVDDEDSAFRDRESAGRSWRVAATVAVAALYIILMPLIGYIPATAITAAAIILVMGVRAQWRNWAVLVVYPLALTILLYVVFTMGLNVRLP